MIAKLHTYEGLLRATFAAGGELMTAAVNAQASKNLNPIVGHDFFRAIGEANVHVSAALASSADGHRRAEALGRRLGYDPTAFGDTVKDPSSSTPTPVQGVQA